MTHAIRVLQMELKSKKGYAENIRNNHASLLKKIESEYDLLAETDRIIEELEEAIEKLKT